MLKPANEQLTWEWSSSSSSSSGLAVPAKTKKPSRKKKSRHKKNSPSAQELQFAISTATAIARRMQFRDRENAVGEAMLCFVEKIFPQFLVIRGKFEVYVTKCLRRCLISQQRREVDQTVNLQPQDDDRPCWCDSQPDERRRAPGVDWRRLVRWLPRRQAGIVRMAYGRRNLSAAEIADELGLKVRAVKHELHKARRAIRIHGGSHWEDLLRR